MFIKDTIILDRCSKYEQIFKPSIFGKVKLSDNKFLTIGLVYRSPNSNESVNIDVLKQFELISSDLKNSNEKL